MPNSSNNQNPKQPEKKQIIIKKSPPGGGKSPEKSSIASYVLSVLIIFVALSALYSYLANSKGATMEISISQLVTDIKSGTVKDVTVQGDAVTIDYKDGTKKTSKKETSEALSQTLVNLGVPSAQLSQVNIQRIQLLVPQSRADYFPDISFSYHYLVHYPAGSRRRHASPDIWPVKGTHDRPERQEPKSNV